MATGGTAPAASNLTDGVDPTVAINFKADVTSNSTTVTGLTASTTYSFRIVPYAWDATNVETYNFRTSDASQLLSITTNDVPPTVTTNSVSNIASGGADVQGEITATGSPQPTARGILYYVYDGTNKVLGDGGVSISEDTSGPYGTGTYTKSLSLSAETR